MLSSSELVATESSVKSLFLITAINRYAHNEAVKLSGSSN
jgi:hypothetical protein